MIDLKSIFNKEDKKAAKFYNDAFRFTVEQQTKKLEKAFKKYKIESERIKNEICTNLQEMLSTTRFHPKKYDRFIITMCRYVRKKYINLLKKEGVKKVDWL